jgi:hypothetical protein
MQTFNIAWIDLNGSPAGTATLTIDGNTASINSLPNGESVTCTVSAKPSMGLAGFDVVCYDINVTGRDYHLFFSTVVYPEVVAWAGGVCSGTLWCGQEYYTLAAIGHF